MVRRLFAVVIVAVFTWMFAGPALAAAIEHDHGVCAPVHHADGTPCPDSHDEGPCDDGCPCVCCPGHAPVASLSSVVALEAPSLMTTDSVGPPDNAHPRGVHRRVFRPPRV
jgi:hypothetical protein